ncbi:hypothetical protein FCL47_11675 [Desulfopila sp. IMCC35006]|uniref:TSUP family transporter n=1 Tax=Desulfopila sp. IMCC35006 TaxID=2569542 RepID=UPI0010ABE0BA|nr:TSUP family transporter [Desulfopila sp. IMCC35006]TKB25761.1 hypothetical protein FCL47_11675 [Desulfopila sp. IMCC35006]
MELYGFTAELLFFLFLTAFVAGFIDTLAGGGGLIVLPALMMSGLPPLSALGTNKLQGTVGTATATYMMLKNSRVKWLDVKFLMLSAFIGAVLGTIAVQFLNTEVLSLIIPAVLLLIAVYFLISPQPVNINTQPRLSKEIYQKFIVPSIGWYDGMFGPGTGSFFALAGVSLRGHGLIDATAVAKTLNFSTNIASLCIFLWAGKVVWLVGIVMMVGQFVGAWGGSHCLLRMDAKYLRFFVVVMCLGMLAKYAFSKGWLG